MRRVDVFLDYPEAELVLVSTTASAATMHLDEVTNISPDFFLHFRIGVRILEHVSTSAVDPAITYPWPCSPWAMSESSQSSKGFDIALIVNDLLGLIAHKSKFYTSSGNSYPSIHLCEDVEELVVSSV